MGMFDSIYCKYPLPNKKHQNLVYQTLNLENKFEIYTISEEGKLIHHVRTFVTVPEEEREYYGTPEWDANQLYRIIGSLKSIPVGDMEIDYDGELCFYAIVNNKEWVDYKAIFVDGTVVEVRKIEM